MQSLCLFMHRLLCFTSMSIPESITAIGAFKYNNPILETEVAEVKQSVSFLEDTGCVTWQRMPKDSQGSVTEEEVGSRCN